MDAFSFIGNIIEFECGEDNIYIGSVLDIDAQKQEISINNVSLNGTKLDVASLKIKAEDINNLTILSQTPKEEKALIPDIEQKPRSIEKKEKKEERFKSSQEQIPQMKKNQIRVEKKGNKKQKQGNQALMNKAEKYTTEFDFEGNLALFDKEAEFNELKENILQGITKSVVRNYKGNENILESEPVSLRQIKIPVEHVGKEYATDSGFIVPAISSELRDKLFTKAERAGLSAMQRTENAGVCTCKMALQLLGGERRICPKNAHQAPEIVLLAGPNLSGLQGICAARHLANHTATVTLFVPEVNSLLQSEIELFKKTNGVIINTVQELPSLPVDLVIDALTCVDNNDTQYDWLPIVIGWANHNKAPVLALDPCIRTAKQDSIVIKWSIALALPLIGSSKCGRLYLVDVGIPSGIFKDVGITYNSPFGDKFVIPLHES
ncbi:enhancer of mRNA-decapping protein 3-like [Rhopilema esculentum]|uniref:enhancer of mRNA-decapping protein 3-like n=1 Tax=Rhopilema esculentum TaxID=499914 RepID=UPI0031DCD6D1